MATIYDAADLPKSKSWIKKLTAPEATEQCLRLGITPDKLLEDNRYLLRKYYDKLGGLDEESSDSEEENPESKHEDENTPSIIGRAGTSTETSSIAQMLATTTQALTQLTRVMANMSTPAPQTAPPPNHSFSAVKELIAAVPLTSGEEPRQMVDFVLAVNKIADTKLVDSASLPVLVLPRTTGRLRATWVDALSKNLPWPQFLRQTLDRTLPPRALEPITHEILYERQGFNQPLSEYLSNLAALAGYFYPEMDQARILDQALTGVNNTTRIALSLFARPTSIQDLMDLAPRINQTQRTQPTRATQGQSTDPQQGSNPPNGSNQPGQGRASNQNNNSYRRNNYYRRNNNNRGRGSNNNASNASTQPPTPANQGNQSGGSH